MIPFGVEYWVKVLFLGRRRSFYCGLSSDSRLCFDFQIFAIIHGPEFLPYPIEVFGPVTINILLGNVRCKVSESSRRVKALGGGTRKWSRGATKP